MAKKKPAPKAAAQGGKPRRGHPAPGQRKIVPDDYNAMAKMFCMGCTYRQIAEKYGVDHATISHHFNNHIFPMVQASSTRSLEAELMKITVLEQVAWQCFYSESPTERRQLIKAELAKLKDKPKAVRKQIESLIEKSVTTVHRSRDKAWMDIVKWCIETRCKLEGHFAAVKVRVQHEEYRVAGQSPATHGESMQERINRKVAELRQREQRLESSGFSLGNINLPSKN